MRPTTKDTVTNVAEVLLILIGVAAFVAMMIVVFAGCQPGAMQPLRDAAHRVDEVADEVQRTAEVAKAWARVDIICTDCAERLDQDLLGVLDGGVLPIQPCLQQCIDEFQSAAELTKELRGGE